MRWKGRRQSSNIEDRRGSDGGSRAGGFRIPTGGGGIRIPTGGGAGRMSGGSLVVIALVVVGLWIFAGINPMQLLDMVSGDGGGGSYAERTMPTGGGGGGQVAGNDEDKQFIATVLAETERTWTRIFREADASYPEPTLVLYAGATQTHCGLGTAAVGPFYCPNDQNIYLDLEFFELMRSRFRSPGDFAQAYVIAHEVGHHVQKQTGVLDEFNRRRQQMREVDASALSVRVELQADCYAGIWAHDADRIGILEEGDIEEALNAAHQIGDDMMQKRTQGHVVPDAFHHGTSAQRMRWFQRGYESGDIAACDTFGGDSL